MTGDEREWVIAHLNMVRHGFECERCAAVGNFVMQAVLANEPQAARQALDVSCVIGKRLRDVAERWQGRLYPEAANRADIDAMAARGDHLVMELLREKPEQ